MVGNKVAGGRKTRAGDASLGCWVQSLVVLGLAKHGPAWWGRMRQWIMALMGCRRWWFKGIGHSVTDDEGEKKAKWQGAQGGEGEVG